MNASITNIFDPSSGLSIHSIASRSSYTAERKMPHLAASVIGFEAPRLVALLVRSFQNIEAITVFRPPPSLPIQQDPSIRGPDQIFIERALGIRNDLNLPF